MWTVRKSLNLGGVNYKTCFNTSFLFNIIKLLILLYLVRVIICTTMLTKTEITLTKRSWIGLDPTNNCIASDRHVRLAIGRHFTDCTPVKGTYKGSSEHTLEVSVTIGNSHGKSEELKDKAPVFSYKTKNPALESNSYRRYLEMQQQQQ